MKNIIRSVKIPTFIILLLLLSLLNLRNFSGIGPKSYEIPEDAVYDKNLKILNTDDRFVIISSHEQNTVVTEFNITSETSKILLKLDKSYVWAGVNQSSFVIAYSQWNGDSTSLHFDMYDVNNVDTKINEFELPIEVNDSERVVMDNQNNFYIIDEKESNQVFVYNPINYDFRYVAVNFNLSTLYLGLDNKVYASSLEDNKNLFILSDNGFDKIGSDIAIKYPITFISDSTFSDFAGKIYSISEGKIDYKFDTCTGKNNTCRYQDDVAVLCGENLILVMDKDTGEELSQFSVEYKPEYIQTLSEDIYSFYFLANHLIIQSMGTPINIRYTDFSENDNVFVPVYPNTADYDIEDFDKEKLWNIKYDQEKVILGSRAKAFVKITNKDTGESYLRDGSQELEIQQDIGQILFVAPENIEVGLYEVIVSGAVCKYNAVPARFIYNINIKYKPEPSSGESSDSDSDYGERIITSEIYNIDRGKNILTGVIPGTTLGKFKNNIKYRGTIYAENASGKAIKSGNIGTGTKIYLLDGEEEYDRLTVVIYGDLTGTGTITSRDVNLAFEYLLGEDVLDEYGLIALDVNHDGDINISDLVLLNRAVKEEAMIEQSQ